MVVLSATTTVFSKDLAANLPGAIQTPVETPVVTTPAPPTTTSSHITPTSSTSSSTTTRDPPSQPISTSSSDIARSTATHSFTSQNPVVPPNSILPELSSPVSDSAPSSLSALSATLPQSPVSQPNGHATNVASTNDSKEGILKKALISAGAALGLLLILAALYRYRISYKRKHERRDEEYRLRARPFALATRVNTQVDYQPPNHATRRKHPVADSIERLKDAFSRTNSNPGPSRVTGQESDVEADSDRHFSTRRVRVVEIVDESDVNERPPEYRWSDRISAI